MLEIVLNNINKSFGSKQVLKNINFEIKTNERVALIGPNGCGKTTILKMINKEDNPTSGDVFIRKGAKVEMLSQYPREYLNNYKVNDIIYDSFKEIIEMDTKLKNIENEMMNATGDKLNKLINKYSALQEKFINIGGYEMNSKVDKLVAAFKINSLLDKTYKELSGGEKTIINLISILLKDPDILLLDEPTNHLDIDMLEWLEKFINSCNKTIVIVSHDRYFLDKVVNKIILIDNGEEEIFNGNYSYFLNENEERVMRDEYKNQQKQIDAMKKTIKKLREWGKLAYPCGEKFFRRAASIEKRLEKMDIIEKPKQDEIINLAFNINHRGSNKIIELVNYDMSIGDRKLFNKVNLLIRYKERICLMGKNGTGKSTFIKHLINRDENIKIGPHIKIGYIPQEIVFENENISVIEEARKYFEGYEEHLRSALVKFLFYSDGIYTRLNMLSGGERLRLKLFCLMQEDNNLLVLDEPTNHIDINTKEILEEALNNYNGTILVVSHDRYFINKIATRIVMIENKNLISYIGNYDDMKIEIARNKKE